MLGLYSFFFASVCVHGYGIRSKNYKVIRRIPVGGDGGWDYLRVDPDAKRIYIARGDHMMIVDETSGKVVGDLPNTKGIHGTALATDLGKGYTSNGGAGTVTVYDLKTLKPMTEIKTTGDNPDSIIYDPATKRVFTMNGRGHNSTVIDATTDKVVGTVDLGGKPEEPALDGRGNMFVNLEDKSSIMEFDTKTLAVKGTWSLAPCDGPSALAADTKNHRFFAACSKMIAVFNAGHGQGSGDAGNRRRSGRQWLRSGYGADFCHLPGGIADGDSRRFAG